MPYKILPRRVVFEQRETPCSKNLKEIDYLKDFYQDTIDNDIKNSLDSHSYAKLQNVLDKMNQEIIRLKNELDQEKYKCMAMTQRIDVLNEDILKFSF